jgi:hypothetical protein
MNLYMQIWHKFITLGFDDLRSRALGIVHPDECQHADGGMF